MKNKKEYIRPNMRSLDLRSMHLLEGSGQSTTERMQEETWTESGAKFGLDIDF